mmetsp:Transcript_9842/g.19347  ORF Transcript_9842/g.19347 Transcript_9842/m.19347 type:complete len:319 (-) Transcript_9842:740-1696(-)
MCVSNESRPRWLGRALGVASSAAWSARSASWVRSAGHFSLFLSAAPPPPPLLFTFVSLEEEEEEEEERTAVVSPRRNARMAGSAYSEERFATSSWRTSFRNVRVNAGATKAPFSSAASNPTSAARWQEATSRSHAPLRATTNSLHRREASTLSSNESSRRASSWGVRAVRSFADHPPPPPPPFPGRTRRRASVAHFASTASPTHRTPPTRSMALAADSNSEAEPPTEVNSRRWASALLELTTASATAAATATAAQPTPSHTTTTLPPPSLLLLLVCLVFEKTNMAADAVNRTAAALAERKTPTKGTQHTPSAAPRRAG